MRRLSLRALCCAGFFAMLCLSANGLSAKNYSDSSSMESNFSATDNVPDSAKNGLPQSTRPDCANVGPDFQSTNLLPITEIARDPDASWSLTTAARQSFQAPPSRKAGYTAGAVWMRLCIHNTDSVDRMLVVDTTDKYFTRAALFVVAHDTEKLLFDTEYGTAMPYAKRLIRARNIVFPLTIHAGQTADVYMRLRSQGHVIVGSILYDETAFLRLQHKDDIIVYLFYGALAALFIYNLLLAVGSKEPAIFACVALIGVWTLLIAGWDGTLYQWWPESIGFYRISYLLLTVAVALIALMIFTIEFLQLKVISRYLVWPCYVFIALALAYIPSIWVLSTPVLRNCIVVLTTLTVVYANIAGWIVFSRGHTHAGIYLLAFLVMLGTTIALTRSTYSPQHGFGEVEIFLRLTILLPISIFCFGIGYRINQLKISATESRQRATLAHAEAQFKSRFLVTMSHEIRTPLNGVVGMIELLQGTPLNEMQQRYVDVIYSSGRALMDVINDVLDFSKLEHGKVKLEIVGFNLERLVDECVDVFAITKKSGSVIFNACIEPDTPRLLMGDPTRTKQILINLVGNAFKFTQEGEVNLTIHAVTLPGHEKPSLKFEVTDTGVGMSDAVQQELFNAFTQADGSITRKYGGTGLGLAICKQLVELMGGSIGVESRPGAGSTFWFTLPLILPRAGDMIEPLQREPALVGKHVLVIDDHDAFCHTMRVTLESFGMLVDIAQTAQAARECIRNCHYDVLIIDRCLPDQDGLELAQDLYSAAKGITPPMLLVSVGVDILEDHTLAQAGIAAHMIKPISLSGLHNRLARLFGAQQQHSLPAAALSNAAGAPLHVLVAEDNHINQVVLGGLLNKLGVEAVFVADGKQAVDLYRISLETKEKPFDAIIMDCEMPHLDGYAATQHIRLLEAKYAPPRSIQIIGLTAHAIDEYRERAFAAGMQDFLTKPVHIETLRRALALVNTTNRPL